MDEKNAESSHPLMRHTSGNSDSSEANNDSHKGAPSPMENNGIVIKRAEPGRAKGCCGIGWFVVNLSALLLLNMIMIVYNVSVVRTLEKRFSLKSTETGLMWSMNDVSHISLVTFVGYFAQTAHKPKVLSVTMLFSAVAGFLMASPYFLFPLPEDDKLLSINGSSHLHGDHYDQLCRTQYSAENGGLMALSDECDAIKDGDELSSKHKAWYLFLFAQLLNGVGGIGLMTLGLAYLDENSSKAKCSLYIGIVTSMYAFGPVGGLLLSAIALRFPENPTETSNLTPEDPMWIGCWWLGYALCSVCILVAIVPMWFFPKHMVPPAPTLVAKNRRNLPSHKSKWQVVLHHLKGFPKSLASLLKNKAFMTLLLMVVCMSFILQGVFVQLVRFLEVHYMISAWKASIITAITAAGAGAIGGFLGGIIMSVLKLTPRGAAWMLSIALGVTTAGVGVVMFMGCPQLPMDGTWEPENHRLKVSTSCNAACGCPEGEGSFSPVCGANGRSYFSPCHAGCSRFANETYSDCKCLHEPSNSSLTSFPLNTSFPLPDTATPGLCQLECNLLYPFSVVIFIMCLMGASARVPGTILQFRIVKPEEKSFALSLISFGMNILAMIPGPILFGVLIDQTCILWQQTCSGSGACLLFDTAKFRLNTYGVTFGFELLAFLLTLLLVYFVYKMDFPPEEEEVNEVEVVSEQDTDKTDIMAETLA